MREIEFMAKNVTFENKLKIKTRINVKTKEVFKVPIFSIKVIYWAFALFFLEHFVHKINQPMAQDWPKPELLYIM